MAASDESSSDTGTKWEGYSDYQKVSQRVSQSVSDALEAYAILHGSHAEVGKIDPEVAADARSDILSAAIRLLVEMQNEQENGVGDYDAILDRWEGEEGYIRRFQTVQLSQSVPGWMFQFVIDIRQAGWKLGYLQAGRRQKQTPEDPVDAEVHQMFDGL